MLCWRRGLMIWCLILTATTSACGDSRVPLIVNGMLTSDYPAVGIVGESSAGGFCSGTLVSPFHVLTAAHCAEAILRFGDAQSGTFTVGSRTYQTSDVVILSTYDNVQFTDDVAILVLSEAVEGIQPMVMSEGPPAVGEQVVLVGFGGQGSAASGSDGTFGQKLFGVTTVESVGDFEFAWKFDDPAESNAAPGDSGGPVIVQRDGEATIVGIVSSGVLADASLGDVTYCMRVDAYLGWIDATVLATFPTGSTIPTVPIPTVPIPTDPTAVPADPVTPADTVTPVSPTTPADTSDPAVAESCTDDADVEIACETSQATCRTECAGGSESETCAIGLTQGPRFRGRVHDGGYGNASRSSFMTGKSNQNPQKSKSVNVRRLSWK